MGKSLNLARVFKRRMNDYCTQDEIDKLVKLAFKRAKHKDDMLKFVLEYLIVKPPQQLVLDDKDNYESKEALEEQIRRDKEEIERLRAELGKEPEQTGEAGTEGNKEGEGVG